MNYHRQAFKLSGRLNHEMAAGALLTPPKPQFATMRIRNDTPITPRGQRVALLFALAAHRLSHYYDHDQWLTEAQGTTLAADWQSRAKTTIPLTERRELSTLSDRFARDIAGQLSREAGLYTAHEMMEALDPNYQSELAQTLLAECDKLLL